MVSIGLSYRETSGKVNEKPRHTSSLHFLVLFLACQAASPVRAKLHSHSAFCIPKYPHLNMSVRMRDPCTFTVGLCGVHICVWRSEEPCGTVSGSSSSSSRFRLVQTGRSVDTLLSSKEMNSQHLNHRYIGHKNGNIPVCIKWKRDQNWRFSEEEQWSQAVALLWFWNIWTFTFVTALHSSKRKVKNFLS